jgi:hypothetical protein
MVKRRKDCDGKTLYFETSCEDKVSAGLEGFRLKLNRSRRFFYYGVKNFVKIYDLIRNIGWKVLNTEEIYVG